MFIPYPKKPNLYLSVQQITAMEVAKGRFNHSRLAVWLSPDRPPEAMPTLTLEGADAVAFLRALAQVAAVPAEIGKAFVP